MDFEEADRRYAELRRRYEAGAVSPEEFDARLRQMMVQDAEGRWWAKDREANEWYYYNEEPPWIVLSGAKPSVLPGEADGWYDYGWILGAPPLRRPGARLLVGGAVCAFLSLFLPIPLGPFGIFLGYMALRAGGRPGIAVMAASGACMILGLIFGE